VGLIRDIGDGKKKKITDSENHFLEKPMGGEGKQIFERVDERCRRQKGTGHDAWDKGKPGGKRKKTLWGGAGVGVPSKLFVRKRRLARCEGEMPPKQKART